MTRIGKYLLICVLSSFAFLSAQTHIGSGSIWGTWTKSNSPYYVDGHVDVPLNSTLTIEPGTSVYFSGKYEFNVHGQLIAEGTETDSIFFFADSMEETNDYPYYTGFWYGITFHATDSTDQETSVLKYCKIRHGFERWLETGHASANFSRYFGGGLIYYKSTIDISNCRIENSLSSGTSIIGIYSSGTIDSTTITTAGSLELLYSSGNIINSLFTHGMGIALDHSDANIINTKINDNQDYFISSKFGAIQTEYSTLNLLNCEIKNNSDEGVNSTQSTVNMLWTDISGNNGSGAYFLESPTSIINCNVRENIEGGLSFFSNTLWRDTTFIADIQNTIVAQNGGIGIILTSNNGANIKNCVIADNTYSSGWAGIYSENSNLTKSTNTIVSNNGSDLNFQAGGLYRYSIVQGNYVGSDTATTNLQNFDPLFRDRDNGDYRLQSVDAGYFFNSPGIDAGDPHISDWLLNNESAGLGTLRSDVGAYGGANNWWDKSLLPPCHFKGNVSGIWGCERIYVDGDILVPEGDTLEILPSVDWVLITGPYEIKVEGVLIAHGTENRAIKFQGLPIDTYAWHGIVFNSTNTRSVGGSVLDYCRFDYANKTTATSPHGGALFIYRSDNVLVKDCYFYSNNARLGGAVYVEFSSPRFEACSFYFNGRKQTTTLQVITSAGGAMYIKDSNPYMHDLKFIENAAHDGAAIFMDHSSPKMSNVLITKNTATGFAGAIFINNSSPHIVNMTSADNHATMGGGSFSLMNSNSHPTIINSILYGNTKPEIYINNGTPVVTYSIIDSASSQTYFGTGCLSNDPLFSQQHNYTLACTSCGDDVSSPAIDAGHPDSIDTHIDCFAGRGTSTADMGYFGGSLWGPQTAISENGIFVNEFKLNKNYPNPFNPTTVISWSLPEAGNIDVSIYNLNGQKVYTLYNGTQNAGTYQHIWNAGTHASGIYIAVLHVDQHISGTQKLLLVK